MRWTRDFAFAAVGVLVVAPAIPQWSDSVYRHMDSGGWWDVLQDVWIITVLTLAVAGAVSIGRAILGQDSAPGRDGTAVVTKGEFEGRQRISDK